MERPVERTAERSAERQQTTNHVPVGNAPPQADDDEGEDDLFQPDGNSSSFHSIQRWNRETVGGSPWWTIAAWYMDGSTMVTGLSCGVDPYDGDNDYVAKDGASCASADALLPLHVPVFVSRLHEVYPFNQERLCVRVHIARQ